jgi:hypothetical protein
MLVVVVVVLSIILGRFRPTDIQALKVVMSSS